MLAETSKDASEFRTKKFWSSVIGEYLGTGLLVFVSTAVCNKTYDSKLIPTGQEGSLECSLAYGLGIVTLVHWTEGLLNPAISVAFTSTGKLSPTKGVLMIMMEILGGECINYKITGISGAALNYALIPSPSRHSLGDTILHEDMSTMQGLFVEFILTFVLTFTVYATRDPGRQCEAYHASLAYGFAGAMCYLVGNKHASCSTNPARSFGPAVIREFSGLGKPNSEWQYHWIYWIGPIGGSLLAGVVYHFLYSQQNFEYGPYKPSYSRNIYQERQTETNL